MLTTEHRGINPKYGRQHVEFNCARWLMFSQHHDALPLEHSDRRVIVIDNPTERGRPEYYKRLYALLDSPTLSTLWATGWRSATCAASTRASRRPVTARR
jgi:hypothetical protein